MQLPIPVGQDPSAFIGKSAFAGSAGGGGGGPLITVPLIAQSPQFSNASDTDVGLSIPPAIIPADGGLFLMETELVSLTSAGYVNGAICKWSAPGGGYAFQSIMALSIGSTSQTALIQGPTINNGSSIFGIRTYDNAGVKSWAARIVHCFTLTGPVALKWLLSCNGAGTGNVYPGSYTRLWQLA